MHHSTAHTHTHTHTHTHNVVSTRTSHNMSPAHPACLASSGVEAGREEDPSWHPAVYHHCGCVEVESLSCCGDVAMVGEKGTSSQPGGGVTLANGCHDDHLV